MVDDTFYQTTKLKNISIPDNIKIYNNNIFRNSGIESFETNAAITSIGVNLFNSCYNLISCLTPNAVLTTLPQGMFSHAHAIKTYDIPATVTVIKSYCFEDAISMTKIIVPKNVATIESYAFSSNQNLRILIMNPTVPPSIQSGIMTNSDNCIVYVPDASLSTYQSATNWATFSTRIKALSTLTQ